MFAAKNLLLTRRKAGGGTVGFDAKSANIAPASTTASTPVTWSHTTVGANATVYADIMLDRAGTLTPVTCDGNAMTLVDTITYPTVGGVVPFVQRYKCVMAAAGAHTISFTPSVAGWTAYGSASYTGVGSEGTMQTASGTGTSASQSATCAAGQMLLQGFTGFYNGGSAMSGSPSPSGGTNRVKTAGLYEALTMSDSAASATFTMTQTAMAYWRGMAHALIPA